MYVTTCYYYEQNVNGDFGYLDPHAYQIESNKEPTAEELDDLLWQMVEIERIEDGQLLLIEQKIEKDGEYFDYNEAVVRVTVVRTKEPSDFIIWKNKIPNIFKVDRRLSKYDIESQQM